MDHPFKYSHGCFPFKLIAVVFGSAQQVTRSIILSFSTIISTSFTSYKHYGRPQEGWRDCFPPRPILLK